MKSSGRADDPREAAAATYLTRPELLAGDEPLEVEGDAYRHLFRARRLRLGDRLRVVDGRGSARLATVTEVDRRSATLRLGEALGSREPARRVDLLVGAPRPERASWLVEKATELGVSRLVFVATERLSRSYGDSAARRWQRVARSAVEQCGRARMPEISGLRPMADALDESPRPILALVPGGSPLASRLPAGSSPVSLVIGPEGGLTAGDLVEIEARGGLPVGLGESILRVETAAVAALSCALWGERAP
ncbi:MAG: RsmE family RNA methyltransferase [Acidobacteriota bacterium]